MRNILHINIYNQIWWVCLFFLTCLCQQLPQNVQSQDIHFSQFLSAPMNLNPAMTGDFDGSYRFIGNGRRQWSSVTIPYQTFGIAADANNFLRVKNVGAGLSLYQDNTGDSRFSTLQAGLSGAYRIRLNNDSTHFLSLGVMTSFTSRRINDNNLRYDNQYNGFVYDPTIPVDETFQNTGRVYPNIHGGILWRYKKRKRNGIGLGFSVFNINVPPQSFFGNSQILLDRRYTAFVSVEKKLTSRIDVLPGLLWMKQGTFQELVCGSSFRYHLNTSSNSLHALYIGGWLRASDAAFALVGMDYERLYVGLSYDINFSNLRPASNLRGGFEFSAIYIIHRLPKKNSYKVCPDYL